MQRQRVSPASIIKVSLVTVVLGSTGGFTMTSLDDDEAAVVSAIENEDSDVPGSIQNKPHVTFADSTDDLDTCKWEVFQQNNTSSVAVNCSSSQRIVSGGCRASSGTHLQGTQFYEGLGWVDPDEDWWATSTPTGMACYFSGSGTHTVMALCCGD